MENLQDYIKRHSRNKVKSLSFIDYFNQLLNEKNLDASEVYNRVNMSRQMYSAIISGKVTPSLNNAVKLAIGLKCSNDECKLLLKKLGYTLASSSKFSLIIRYCLENKIYDYFKINELLNENGCEELK